MRWARPLGLVLAVLSFVGAGALLPDLEQRTEDAGLRYTDSVVEGAALGGRRDRDWCFAWSRGGCALDQSQLDEGGRRLLRSDGPFRPHHQTPTSVCCGLGLPRPQHGLQHLGGHPHVGRAMGLGSGWSSLGAKRRAAAQPRRSRTAQRTCFLVRPQDRRQLGRRPPLLQREFTREWHFLLGSRPRRWKIASLGCGRLKKPLVLFHSFLNWNRCSEVRDRLLSSVAPLAEQAGVNLELDSDFLLEYGIWDAIRQNPTGAALLGIDDQVAAERPWPKPSPRSRRTPTCEVRWTSWSPCASPGS